MRTHVIEELNWNVIVIILTTSGRISLLPVWTTVEDCMTIFISSTQPFFDREHKVDLQVITSEQGEFAERGM